MIHIKDIFVKNFKNLKDVEIQDFGSVNIFVGANGIGKTNVFDAIKLIASMENTTVLFLVMYNGQERLLSMNDFKRLFHENNTSNDIEISANLSKGRMYKYQLKLVDNNIQLTTTNIGRIPRNKIISEKDLLNNYLGDSHKSLCCDYSSLDELAVNALLKFLQSIDKKIKGIEYKEGNIWIDYNTIRFPLRSMGHGFAQLLRTSIYLLSNGEIIFLDPVDDTLHHEAIEKLILFIFENSVNAGRQIFMTTNSWETLTYIKKAIEQKDSESWQNAIRIYNMTDAKRKGIMVHKQCFEGLRLGIDCNIEFRN